MKVCLANLPWEVEEKWGIRAGCRFPNLMPKRHNSYLPFPFLLAYAASYLESDGVQVLLIDGVAERSTVSSFLERLGSFRPDLLIVETATTSLAHDLAVLDLVRARQPEARIAVCGPHVSMLPDEALRSPSVDFVIMGEPEITALELTHALGGGNDYAGIPGLAFRNGAGDVFQNPRREMMADLDVLPYPMRRGLPMNRYNVPGFPAPVVYMYASRGCPYVCNFCLWVQTIFDRHRYVPRSPARIVDEIQHVMKEFPDTKSLFFDDDTFNIGKDRLREFAAEMKRRGVRIPWGMNARADNWDAGLVRDLRDTGLFNVRFGIESGDPEVLARSGKALNLDEVRENLRLFREMGIKNHLNFMVGLAGESWDSIKSTVKFVKSVPADSVQFTVAVPFPKTEYYNDLDAGGLLVSRNWDDYHAGGTAVMSTQRMSAEEIERAIRWVRRRVYLSPRFIIRRFGYIRNFRDAAAIARKGLALLKPA
jgi:radical SAM superfamily enzyme YgiQ (UPF0313 family)